MINRGKRKTGVEELRINGNQMKNVNEYKCLGEYINEKRTETTTVDKRISEASAISNEILAVASSNELKHRRIEIGMKLAKACLDSKLLRNAETWTKVKTTDIKKLESVQNNFFKRLIGVPGGTTNVAITKELGIIPVEYIYNPKNSRNIRGYSEWEKKDYQKRQ